MILLVASFNMAVNAQTISNKVIANGGGYSSAGGYSLSYTIGETITTTLSNGGYVITQGFQQPFTMNLQVKALL